MRQKILFTFFIGWLFASTALAQLQMPEQDPLEIETKIRQVFSGADVMVDIAKCESGMRQYNSDFSVIRGGLGGNYIGIFQIAQSHEENAKNLGHDIYSVDGNIGFAKVLYDAQGTQPWVVCTKNSNAVQSQAATVNAIAPLTKNLQIGAVNEQVRTLQKLLNSFGYTLAASGPGSPGNETSIFGSLTKAAIQKFQCEQNIVCSGNESSTGYGRFGPKTRAALLNFSS